MTAADCWADLLSWVDEMTAKHGNPIGTDYEQGVNDHGFRIRGRILKLIEAARHSQPGSSLTVLADGSAEAMGAWFEAYATWPDDVRRKLSIHDVRRMAGWRQTGDLNLTPSPSAIAKIEAMRQSAASAPDIGRTIVGAVSALAASEYAERLIRAPETDAVIEAAQQEQANDRR